MIKIILQKIRRSEKKIMYQRSEERKDSREIQLKNNFWYLK